MWPRVDGLRSLELGQGEVRDRLNRLVLEGKKIAGAGLLAEYMDENEELEHPGERLALIDNDGAKIATVEVTAVHETTFDEVTWEFAQAEGEGFTSIEHWRQSHRRYWTEVEGRTVTSESPIVCSYFQLLETA
ncbi:MAG TPA: ASCH domain-containing protein [Actinomycetes bacterium]|nr:ASCH domain-containing protein [Actinomycetes bacterium]